MRTRPRPYPSRRLKLTCTAVFVATAATLLGLGWLSWGQAAALAMVELTLISLVPTRENKPALERAEQMGIIERQ